MLDALVAKFDARLTQGQALHKLSWLRTGGASDWFFQPTDIDDLAAFLKACPKDVPLFPMGVGSNTIFRDGGFEGCVIKLGRAFMGLEFREDGTVYVGAAMLDAMMARRAAKEGLDATFLRTIPGAIGGAIAMNAGCYGKYIADVITKIDILTRDGVRETLDAKNVQFDYRYTHLPEGCVILGALFDLPKGAPDVLEKTMEDQLAKRAQSQPTKDLSCGSTFRNPVGYSSTGEADDDMSLKAWKVIDDAGLRGFSIGGAQMSEMHPNFLINTGGATAFELESLGEHVRKVVKADAGVDLTWEIRRVGRFMDDQKPDWT